MKPNIQSDFIPLTGRIPYIKTFIKNEMQGWVSESSITGNMDAPQVLPIGGIVVCLFSKSDNKYNGMVSISRDRHGIWRDYA